MLALTVMLIAVGATLAALGTLGFTTIARTAPHRDDLAYTRALATTGRWASGIGLGLLTTGHHAIGGVALLAVYAVIALAVASLVTKAPLRPRGVS